MQVFEYLPEDKKIRGKTAKKDLCRAIEKNGHQQAITPPSTVIVRVLSQFYSRMNLQPVAGVCVLPGGGEGGREDHQDICRAHEE